jgi:antibiotic biosynthesis monooxygenase (ABM) superfamily enzyme
VNTPARPVAGPPNKHQLAVMIWLAFFPTLTVLNLVLGDWLEGIARPCLDDVTEQH